MPLFRTSSFDKLSSLVDLGLWQIISRTFCSLDRLEAKACCKSEFSSMSTGVLLIR